jgi:hypothetical protein
MVYLCDRIRKLATGENLRYVASEFGAIGFSYACAVGATIGFKETGCSDGVNVIGTAVVKSGAFWLGNVLTYKVISIYQKRDDCGEDLAKLSKSNFEAILVTNGLRIGGHYLLIKTRFIPYSVAALISYSGSGVAGAVLRHYKNYRNRLFHVADLDEIVDKNNP